MWLALYKGAEGPYDVLQGTMEVVSSVIILL